MGGAGWIEPCPPILVRRFPCVRCFGRSLLRLHRPSLASSSTVRRLVDGGGGGTDVDVECSGVQRSAGVDVMGDTLSWVVLV